MINQELDYLLWTSFVEQPGVKTYWFLWTLPSLLRKYCNIWVINLSNTFDHAFRRHMGSELLGSEWYLYRLLNSPRLAVFHLLGRCLSSDISWKYVWTRIYFQRKYMLLFLVEAHLVVGISFYSFCLELFQFQLYWRILKYHIWI